MQKGASQRPSKVIYDRAGSSIALASRSDLLGRDFDGADWLHSYRNYSPHWAESFRRYALKRVRRQRREAF